MRVLIDEGKAGAVVSDPVVEPAADREALVYSQSEELRDRFQRRRALRRSVALAYVALMCIYLGWRLTVINPHSLGLSLAYYLAECLGFVLGLTAIACSWSYNHRSPPPAPLGLSVDVLVPTYREPLWIIRRTLIAARDIAYPHGTLVLDDGNRAEIRALAAELGIRYAARGENLHAKAGNLNFGLGLSCADFVAVFDADHIAVPHALHLLLGFFDDPSVGLVQTPQDYYNVDAFQYVNARGGRALWHDQSFFYGIAQACKDSFNAASCVGTGVVYRRSALDAIGGIPTATMTEDMHTSLRMQQAGLLVVYCNESIAFGIAASDLREYCKTRHRWAHGNIRVATLERVAFDRRLTLRQRLGYLGLVAIYLEGWQQLLLMTIPIGALLLGWAPFQISILNVLVVLLFPFVSYALLQEIGCGFSRFWVDELFAMARWPVHLLASSALFRGARLWRTSSKNIKGRLDPLLMLPQITVLLVSLTAVGIAIGRLGFQFEWGPLGMGIAHLLQHPAGFDRRALTEVLPAGYSADLVVIAGFWAMYNALRAAVVLRKSVGAARRTHEFYRFPIALPAFLDAGGVRHPARLEGISEVWARMIVHGGRNMQPGSEMPLELYLPSGPLVVRVRVEKVKHVQGGRALAEVGFLWTDDAARDVLAADLYAVGWHRECGSRYAHFLTFFDLFARLLSRTRSVDLSWDTLLVGGRAGTVLAFLGRAGRRSELLCFCPLHPGERVAATMFGCESVVPLTVTAGDRLPVGSHGSEIRQGNLQCRYAIQFSTRAIS
jgi:cellulose synthase (UDP-forming)